MRLFNQQRYDADLIRALQAENEALHKRNAVLERWKWRREWMPVLRSATAQKAPCHLSEGSYSKLAKGI